MTFNDVTFRMFKANIRRYLLYFLCNSFTIMIMFTYLTLLTNKSFMDVTKVNSVISSNIIAPSYIIGIFSIFFIIYTQNSFIKFRKREFGLFMVLGMNNAQISSIMLIENSVIAVISLLAGLLAGTLFSKIFYFIFIKIVNISGFSFTISYKSYLYTAAFFTAIYIVVILFNIIASLDYTPIKLLNSRRVDDKDRMSGKISGFIGIAAIAAAAIIMVFKLNEDLSNTLLISLFLFFIGMYLVISSFVWFLNKIISSDLKKYYRNMFFISNIKHSFNQSKKIIFAISLLVGITIFFSSLSMTFGSSSENFAVSHNPYDIAYVEIFGKNDISKDRLKSIIQNGETPLTFNKNLEFINTNHVTILSDQNLNSILKTSVHVSRGYFINLFQIVKNDGYTHDTTEIKRIDIQTKAGDNIFISQGSMKEMLFNNTVVLNNSRYMIVNSNDYMKIKTEVNADEVGHINLMNFKDWKKTGSIAKKLQNELEDYNRANTKLLYNTSEIENMVLKPASKIVEYTEQKQSGSFILFLFVFVGILFYFSSAAILHFKLMTEFEREKIKYRKLYKIGITDNEVSKNVSKELAVLFFLPYIFGILFSTFYSYFTNGSNVYVFHLLSVLFSLVIGLIYSGLQLLLYIIYKKIYIKKLISCVQ